MGREAGNKLPSNFNVGLQAHLLGYKGVNLGEITQVQNQAHQWALAWIQAKKEVAASLQQPQMDTKLLKWNN